MGAGLNTEHTSTAGWGSVASPPARALTLLFTDIEGSTQLLEATGERYGDLLNRHLELLREAIAKFRGREVDVHGDAMFAVFDEVEDAVAAAVHAQRLLHEEPWPHGATLRVRMGLHTGYPRQMSGPQIGFVGIDVHLAARICDVGHGGQIVLSNASRNALLGRLPAAVRIRDLGTHRLKDIRFPETLCDLVIEHLPTNFAPIRSLSNRPNNLPTALTPFIGRAAEKAELVRMLCRAEVRMVTLTGVGGSGKTRLSIEVARSLLDKFPDGVFQVPLAAVPQARLVAPTIAQTMGVPEFPGRSVVETISRTIGGRRILLVIDNFEQVLPAADALEQLLNDCPNLKLIVTSREGLNIAPEREFPVLPFTVPDPAQNSPEAFLGCDAVQLFLDRVRAVRPDFQPNRESASVLAEICNRLDGLPLAIELAASRLRVLEPPGLLKRMAGRLNTLGRADGNPSGRHRTMRNAIAWSYNLLDEPEQRAFCAASVFAGGFSLDSAEALFGESDGDAVEHLTSLVRKSLIQSETVEGEVRLRMLETLRDFGHEQLKQSGTLADFKRRHMLHMLEIAERMAPDLATRNQRRSVGKLLTESDNLRAAMDHAMDLRDGDVISRFLKSLLWLWISRSQFTEGEAWITKALQRTGGLVGSRERAIVTEVAGWLKLIAGDWSGALPFFQDCLPIYERLQMQPEATKAKMLEGIMRLTTASDRSALAPVQAALQTFKDLGDQTGIGLTLTALGECARLEGRNQDAEACFQQALDAMRAVGNTYWTLALLENIAQVRLQNGDWVTASGLLKEALSLSDDYEDPTLVNSYVAAMGQVALIRGLPDEAARLLGAADHFLKTAGVKFAPADQAQFEQCMEKTRALLGDPLYGTRIAEGASWSPTEAIAATVRLQSA
ncbi:MAG TPA: tetratricopeptide repeat protein [Candidatus Cybelea sp.]|nr:tetratricopeptide repeat protein [Candidatus Cybelea sp.]